MKPVEVLYFCFILYSVTVTGDDSTNDCNFCAWETCNPTIEGIEDSKFEPENDAHNIKKAIGMIYVNKDSIVDILSHRTEKQREAIISKYSEIFQGKNMKQDITDSVYGDINTLMGVMLSPLSVFYATELKKAIKNNNLEKIVEILTILPPCAIQQVNQQYKNIDDKSLNDAIDTLNVNYDENKVVKVLQFLAEGNRPEPTTKEEPKDESKTESKGWKQRVMQIKKRGDKEIDPCKQDAEDLKKVIIRDSWEEKHAKFKELFGTRTLPQLRDIIQYYDSHWGSLERAITDKAHLETAGTIYMTILKIAMNQPEYFATKVKVLLKPKLMWFVDRGELNYIVLGRCSIDLGDIKKAFLEKHNKKLYDAFYKKIWRVQNDYYKAILSIIKED